MNTVREPSISAGLLTSTVTPGSRPPVSSVTEPAMPEDCWPTAATGKISTAATSAGPMRRVARLPLLELELLDGKGMAWRASGVAGLVRGTFKGLLRVIDTPPCRLREKRRETRRVAARRRPDPNEAAAGRLGDAPRRVRGSGKRSVVNDDAMHLPGNSLSGYGLDDDRRYPTMLTMNVRFSRSSIT